MSAVSPIVPPPPAQPAQSSNCNKAHLDPLPPSVFTLPQTAQLEALYTIIRNKETSRGDFLFYSDRIIRLLVEEGLNHLPVVAKTVQTPTVGSGFHQISFTLRIEHAFVFQSRVLSIRDLHSKARSVVSPFFVLGKLVIHFHQTWIIFILTFVGYGSRSSRSL